jgi:ribonuclease PH
MTRIDGRKADELRPMQFLPGAAMYAEGSCEVTFGRTKLLVAATIEKEVPEWLKAKGEGWITAEYGMLPRATHTRNKREAASGKQSGRTLEIQRLIGRALRAAINLKELGPLTIRIDCDVICADGGTRTAAINGAWVALHQAIKWAAKENLISRPIELAPVSAISAGKVGGISMIDLCYDEDSTADFDINFVLAGNGEIVELQGTAEKGTISRKELDALFELASSAATKIFNLQRQALGI